MRYPAAEFLHESPDVVAEPIVPQGTLIPVDKESYNHAAGVVKFSPDYKLYATLGQPFNVAPTEKSDPNRDVGIGGIIQMSRHRSLSPSNCPKCRGGSISRTNPSRRCLPVRRRRSRLRYLFASDGLR